jgi:hypothetical protein
MIMSTGGTLTTLEFSRLVKRIMQERKEKRDNTEVAANQNG